MVNHVKIEILKPVPGHAWPVGGHMILAESDAKQLEKDGFVKILDDGGELVVKVIKRIPGHGYNPGEIINVPTKTGTGYLERGFAVKYPPDEAPAATPEADKGKGSKADKGKGSKS